MALGINIYLIPHEVLDGGVIGIGLILHYIMGLKTGLMIIVISIPIFMIAWFYNKSYFYNSMHGLLISSLFIDVFQPIQSLSMIHPLISSIIGGVFIGCGIGIMLRFKTSTGGTDLIAQIIAEMLLMNTGVVIFILDFVIILIGGLLISPTKLFLSFVTILFVGIATSIFTKSPFHNNVLF